MASSNNHARLSPSLAQEIKTAPRTPAQPIALNLREAAKCLSITYETARSLGLYERWEEAGVIWRIPGTSTKRVLYEALKRWVYQQQEQDQPALALLFKGLGPSA